MLISTRNYALRSNSIYLNHNSFQCKKVNEKNTLSANKKNGNRIVFNSIRWIHHRLAYCSRSLLLHLQGTIVFAYLWFHLHAITRRPRDFPFRKAALLFYLTTSLLIRELGIKIKNHSTTVTNSTKDFNISQVMSY